MTLTTSCQEATLNPPITSYEVVKVEGGYQVTIPDIFFEEERCILATASLRCCPEEKKITRIAVIGKVEFHDLVAKRQGENGGDGNSKKKVCYSICRNPTVAAPIPSVMQGEVELHRLRCDVASTLDMAAKTDFSVAKEMLVNIQGSLKTNLEKSQVEDEPLANHLMCDGYSTSSPG